MVVPLPGTRCSQLRVSPSLLCYPLSAFRKKIFCALSEQAGYLLRFLEKVFLEGMCLASTAVER